MYILNALGEAVPCADPLAWGQWMETANRKIDATDIGTMRVSTVFLGLDYAFGSSGPLIYETKVLGGPLHGETYRYATRVQAQRGHEAMCARARLIA